MLFAIDVDGRLPERIMGQKHAAIGEPIVLVDDHAEDIVKT